MRKNFELGDSVLVKLKDGEYHPSRIHGFTCYENSIWVILRNENQPRLVSPDQLSCN